MANPDEFVLSGDTARRVIAAVKYFESLTTGSRPERTAPRNLPYRKVGKVTAGITARSGSTPGSGTVQPYLLTATSMAAAGDPVTVYNWTGSTVAAGKGVEYTVVDGVLFWDGNDCSSVAFP